MKTMVKMVLTIVALLVFTLLAIASGEDKSESAQKKIETAKETAKEYAIGSVANIGYFEVTVHSAQFKKQVYISDYEKLGPEDGVQFAVIDVQFKNISKESRMLFDGDLLIKNGTQTLVMDQTETTLSEGWGLLLDSINPMVSKRTKIVYKISSEVKGKVYYNPARDESNSLFYLGKSSSIKCK